MNNPAFVVMKPIQILAPTDFTLSITKDGLQEYDKFEWANFGIPFIIAPKNKCGTLVHYASGNLTELTVNSKCSYLTAGYQVSSLELKNFIECSTDKNGFLKGNIFIMNSALPTTYETVETIDCLGYSIQNVETRTILYSAQIEAKGYFNINGINYYLTGTSNTFNIKPFYDYYKLLKKNENRKIVDLMKTLCHDQKIKNSDGYWRFMNGMYGDSVFDLNVSLLEKVANFSENNDFVDYCHNRKIKTFYHLFNETINDYIIAKTPDSLDRLLNIFSIDYSKLFGHKCSCNTFFKLDGLRSDDAPCKTCKQMRMVNNLGDMLSYNYQVTAGVPFLYLYKGELDVNIIYPSIQNGLSTYALSALEDHCINQNYKSGCACSGGIRQFEDFCFYEWNQTPQNNILNNFLLFKNDETATNIDETISRDEWENDVMDEILSLTLFQEMSSYFN